MARRIELWPLDRLVPYARNARTHSADQVARIAASIAEFGFVNPILVDSRDGVVAGHVPAHISQRIPRRGCESSRSKGGCLTCSFLADGHGQDSRMAGTIVRVRVGNQDSNDVRGNGGLEKTRTSDLLRVKQAL